MLCCLENDDREKVRMHSTQMQCKDAAAHCRLKPRRDGPGGLTAHTHNEPADSAPPAPRGLHIPPQQFSINICPGFFSSLPVILKQLVIYQMFLDICPKFSVWGARLFLPIQTISSNGAWVDLTAAAVSLLLPFLSHLPGLQILPRGQCRGSHFSRDWQHLQGGRDLLVGHLRGLGLHQCASAPPEPQFSPFGPGLCHVLGVSENLIQRHCDLPQVTQPGRGPENLLL